MKNTIMKRNQILTMIGLAALYMATAANGKAGCGAEPAAIIAEVDQKCGNSDVQCGSGLDCVSHYDGGKMFCKVPCSTDAQCSGGQVCDAAPQLTDAALASAAYICQYSCNSFGGSGCGKDLESPNAIVKWEVLEVEADAYTIRGLNSQGDTYLDADLEWYGEGEVFSVKFVQPAFCQVTVSITEATVYDNTCDGDEAEAISAVGIDLWSDIEAKLADANDDGNFLDTACPFIVGGFGITSVLFASSIVGVIAAAAVTGVPVAATVGVVAAGAWPVMTLFALTAGGCVIYGVATTPPMSQCIKSCSFGNTNCFEGCVDKELEDSPLSSMTLLPQCLLACEEDDTACVTACTGLLP